MNTHHHTWTFWLGIVIVLAPCSAVMFGEQPKHNVTLHSDSPITIEGDNLNGGGFAPPPPAISIHEDCKTDQIVTQVLTQHWDDGIEANVRHNRNFGFRATVALYQYCAGGNCPGLLFDDGIDAALDGWLLWWYNHQITTARGGGERCGVLRRQVTLGRNNYKCVMYCPSSGVCAGVLRELHDLDYLDKHEKGRCSGEAIAQSFELVNKGESIKSAEPDPAFNMAITSREE